jgi:uncharacterized membrane protein
LTTQRLEAFSDGVFAVAITLLAFELRLPSLPPNIDDSELYRALLALAPRFYSYLVSFVLVGMFWVAHHNIFVAIERPDRPLMWMNLVTLLWVCLLPFSATTLGAYPGLRSAAIFYGLNLMLIGQSLFWMWRYACHRRFILQDLGPELIRMINRKILLGSPLYAAGIAAAFWDPRISSTIYVMAILVYILPSKLDRHLRTHGDSR